MEALLPEGITTVADLPWHLFEATRTALVYLSWEANLPKDELPPKRIWDDPEALNEHFEMVEKRRREGRDGKNIEDPVQNEAAKSLIAE